MREKPAVIRRVFRFALVAALLSGIAVQQSGAAPPSQATPGMADMKTMPLQQPMPGMSIYNLPSHWTRHDGAELKLSSLRGHSVVAAMVYTHCKDICPLIAERMQEVESALPARSRNSVKFALLSLDWQRDAPQQLRLFASQHHLDMRHWVLFHGDEAAVRELAAALGVSFYRDANGDFQHSIVISLLDPNGVVVGQQSDLSKRSPSFITKVEHSLVSGRN